MENPVLLIICALVIYVIMTICAFIPICIVTKKSIKDGHLSQSTERIISFCNCMAGGVFIAMCFLGLLPYAKDKTALVLEELQVKTDFPVTEFVVILGFFVIMTVEQFIIQFQDNKKRQKLRQRVWNSSSSVAKNTMSSTKSGPSNHFDPSNRKNEEDDESCTQLLSESPNPSEVVSPDASVQPPIDGRSQMPRIYQNVPMVILKTHEENPKSTADEIEHCHQRHLDIMMSKPNLIRFMLLYVSISIHSVFEGMALGLQADRMRIFHLFFAILFHEALVGLSVGITMARQQLTLIQGIKYVLVFSLSVPVGIILGLIVQQTPGIGGSVASAILQSLATGIFVHVTFLELIPAEFLNQKDRLAKIAFHFLGFLSLAVVTATMGSHH